MKYIIAGPDGSGKTHFARKLANQLDISLKEFSITNEDKLATAKEIIRTRENMVLDRFFIPDHFVYYLIKGYKIRWDEMVEWAYFIDRIDNSDIVIIYIDAEDELIKRRLEERGDEFVTFEDVENIRKAYYKVLNSLPFKVIHLENTGDNYNYNLGEGIVD